MSPMDEQQRKASLKETFDTVSTGYDGKALRFFPESAEHLAAILCLHGDEQVLDVATGTGHAALALAGRLPKGRVTAVDFSPGMLEQARRKAASLNVRNVEFLERDMQDLAFPGGHFDAAVCSFGIFFAEDMDSQLAHITSTVRSKGQVAISSFQEGYFDPLKDLMVKRLSSYGAQMPPQTWKRIANVTGCRTLFAQVGLRDIRVEAKNVGYFLEDSHAWWDIIWNAGFRRLVGQLTPSQQEQFRGEHLAEISALATKEGLWLDVGVLFTIGMKA
jgi:ubiquinone/menaquinone biosynthesis C-methylase UbiE